MTVHPQEASLLCHICQLSDRCQYVLVEQMENVAPYVPLQELDRAVDPLKTTLPTDGLLYQTV